MQPAKHWPWLLILLSLSQAAISGGKGLTALTGGQPAPDFELPLFRGGTAGLADFGGGVLVVNFWASWCQPCIREMPSLERGAAQLEALNGRVITINVGESREQIARFLDRHSLALPILMDRDTRTAMNWQVPGLPASYVVNPEGILAYRAYGSREWDDPGLLAPIRALIPAE